MLDNEVLDPSYDEDGNEEDNDVLPGDIGKSLIIKKNLLALK